MKAGTELFFDYKYEEELVKDFKQPDKKPNYTAMTGQVTSKKQSTSTGTGKKAAKKSSRASSESSKHRALSSAASALAVQPCSTSSGPQLARKSAKSSRSGPLPRPLCNNDPSRSMNSIPEEADTEVRRASPEVQDSEADDFSPVSDNEDDPIIDRRTRRTVIVSQPPEANGRTRIQLSRSFSSKRKRNSDDDSIE
jgi:hypothetical protein